MATRNAAINYANVTRELRVLEYVAQFVPPEFEELRDSAMGEDSQDLRRRISETKTRIAELREHYPVTRWVDSDPVYRDENRPWVNNH